MRGSKGLPNTRREHEMIKATIKTNGENVTKFFDLICEAMKWVRSFGLSVTECNIYGADGNLYYSF